MLEAIELERCVFCDARYDVAELHELVRHLRAECVLDDVPHVHIRGELVEEPPQG